MNKNLSLPIRPHAVSVSHWEKGWSEQAEPAYE